jgi:2-polyprenyl-3-methyl-5-hydroxy-6-metoxy-1,4-benzoquinol methylase
MPLTPRETPAPILYIPRPSSWLFWHDQWIGRGARVLDLACGEGRHALLSAQRGATVTAVDRDASKLDTGREAASRLGVTVDWQLADLEGEWPELGIFDVVLVFNFLDRQRMPQIRDLVAPGGLLIMETFLEWQRALGWGPTDDEHLLRPGELSALVRPLEPVHGREVFEPLDAGRQRAVASIVAQRR